MDKNYWSIGEYIYLLFCAGLFGTGLGLLMFVRKKEIELKNEV